MKQEENPIPPRYLVVAVEEIDHDALPESQASLHDYIVKASSMKKSDLSVIFKILRLRLHLASFSANSC